MFKIGNAPYLECSSKGDKRFSAFYARLKCYGNKSIEEIYQESKIVNGVKCNSWREGKGKKADNIAELAILYSKLWDLYFEENPELINIIKKFDGFSDMFGNSYCQCQAKEIYRIRYNI